MLAVAPEDGLAKLKLQFRARDADRVPARTLELASCQPFTVPFGSPDNLGLPMMSFTEISIVIRLKLAVIDSPTRCAFNTLLPVQDRVFHFRNELGRKAHDVRVVGFARGCCLSKFRQSAARPPADKGEEGSLRAAILDLARPANAHCRTAQRDPRMPRRSRSLRHPSSVRLPQRRDRKLEPWGTRRCRADPAGRNSPTNDSESSRKLTAFSDRVHVGTNPAENCTDLLLLLDTLQKCRSVRAAAPGAVCRRATDCVA